MLDRPLPQASLTPAKESTARALLERLIQSGYERIEPSILQNAMPFLELGGEDLRASLYFTTDRSGSELCLRPEYTIPVCRAYLASGGVGRVASYSYCGPVFRMQADTTGEFTQAGLESFGREDAPAADAEILSVALDAARAAGGETLTVQFSDNGLLSAVLDALHLPPNWQRRLKRGLERGEPLDAVLGAAPDGNGDHSGVLAALAGSNARDARALVHDLLSIAGIASVGGRSADEIAERFLAQVALRTGPGFSVERRSVLAAFLAIDGPPDEAARLLRKLAGEAGLALGAMMDGFEERNGFMAANDIDLGQVAFRAAFGRNLDYYTGFVFEASRGGHDDPVVGGGRYDGLARALGHLDPVPAVGAAIWLDRVRPS